MPTGYPAPQVSPPQGGFPQQAQGMPSQGQNPQVAQMLQQGNMQGAMELQNQLAAQNGKAIQMPPRGYSPMQRQVPAMQGNMGLLSPQY
jgi:hypothetical protein